MAYPRQNALDQALDIAGSLTQTQTMTEGDEPNGFGAPIAGQTGTTATITAFASGVLTLGGLTGMTVGDVGNFITISGAATAGNNGTFLIVNFNSASSVDVSNATGSFPDANSGALTWTERGPYTLQDDLNYVRTDRKLIKGTTNWYDPIPTYQRPTAVGTLVSANLSTIAGKTTDAVAYNVNRAFFGKTLNTGDGYTVITSVGNLKHADAVNQTGIPCFDLAPFVGDWTSAYVHIVDGYADGYAGQELLVQSGPHAGERIFGVTFDGYSVSPNSVTIKFFSAPLNLNYVVSATPYVWEAGQPKTINILYGYNERLDQLDQNAFRTIPALGILTDASMQGEINNILTTVGITGTTTSLSGLLTNIGTYYPFYNLPNATPTVVDALNTLNNQIGNRTYTGTYLTSGQTITASLQALSNAINASTISRTIERLSSTINANTAHTLPGGLTYTLDGTNNGQHLWVFTRGVLRDPGPVSGGNDYSETSTTSITFYGKQKAGDHINYIVKT
jgi:hypothetical protein